MTDGPDLDWLISVDDHILEPPNLWIDRLPAKDHDRAPHMEERNGIEGWVYDGNHYPSSGLSAVVGKTKEEFSPAPLPLLRDAPRLLRPDGPPRGHGPAGILGVAVLPDAPPVLRPALHGGAVTGTSACMCVQAYNDWMIDEWCGAAPGRFIPLMLIPLWDPHRRRRGDGAMRGTGRDDLRLLREPRAARPADDPRPGPLLGPGDGGGERPRDGRVDARRLVVDRCPRSRPDVAVHRQPDLRRDPDCGDDALVDLQRHVRSSRT